MWNLIPSIEEGYEDEEVEEYQLKMLCYIVSGERPSEYERLYNECTLLEVNELLMLRQAYNW